MKHPYNETRRKGTAGQASSARPNNSASRLYETACMKGRALFKDMPIEMLLYKLEGKDTPEREE